MRRAFAFLLAAMAVGGNAEANEPHWQASPRIVVELSEHRYALISVSNVEDRDICRNDSEWPGIDGRLTGDDFVVRGVLDQRWSYSGVLIYPSRKLLRLKPRESIATKVDLLQYYRSDKEGDKIVAVEWMNFGFIYCDIKAR